MPLTALPPKETTVDACARALRGAILAQEYGAGVRLPPERTLAESFRVNRVTVRGALSQLVKEGLLSVRQGSGYVVQDYLSAGGPELVLALTRTTSGKALEAAVRDLLEVRRAVAQVVLLRLAKKKPTREAVAQVDAAVDRLADLVRARADAQALAAADLEVLGTVVSATGSEVLRLTLNPVAGVLLGLPALVRAMFKKPEENVAAWKLFVEWLASPSLESVDLGAGALAAMDDATLKALRREAA